MKRVLVVILLCVLVAGAAYSQDKAAAHAETLGRGGQSHQTG